MARLSQNSGIINPEFYVLVHDLVSLQGEVWDWPQYMEGKERTKKEADPSRLIRGTFNKQGNLHMTLLLGSHLPNSKAYIELKWIKPHIWPQWSQ